jgi:hypothetical protein
MLGLSFELALNSLFKTSELTVLRDITRRPGESVVDASLRVS